MSDSDIIAYDNHRLTVANAELRKERDELKQRIRRLEEAGDALANNHKQFTFIDWLKAKEAKP